MYIKKILLVIVGLSFIAGGVFCYKVYNTILNPNTNFEEKQISLNVKTGTTAQVLLNQIRPFLKDVESFNWVAKKKKYYDKIKAGHYILKKGMSNDQIVNTLRSNNTPVKVSFNNQERIENLAGRIAQQIEVDSIQLLTAFKDPVFLKANNLTLETAMSIYIPNSYQFFWNTSAEKFRSKMLNEYKRFWNPERKQQAKKIGLTPTEVYTLASIVHKETVKADERPRVAGVYMNRLIKGIKLDADPTVIFALKKHSNNWDQVIKQVLFKDLKLQHPYNTYQNRGLPPGPIAMPDISALKAVLNYEKHDYYYFVADVNRIGYHKFASSLTQHNRNSVAYHNWIKKQGYKR